MERSKVGKAKSFGLRNFLLSCLGAAKLSVTNLSVFANVEAEAENSKQARYLVHSKSYELDNQR